MRLTSPSRARSSRCYHPGSYPKPGNASSFEVPQVPWSGIYGDEARRNGTLHCESPYPEPTRIITIRTATMSAWYSVLRHGWPAQSPYGVSRYASCTPMPCRSRYPLKMPELGTRASPALSWRPASWRLHIYYLGTTTRS